MLEGVGCGVVRPLEGEPARETSLLASATAAGHATAHATEGVTTAATLEVETTTSSTSTSHAAPEHLHENLGIDAAAHSTHATHTAAAAEHVRRINQISARVVSLTFPADVSVRLGSWL
jgi:acetaldehyde dehydrogenase (acetylating)